MYMWPSCHQVQPILYLFCYNIIDTENAEDFFEGDILLTLDQTEQMIKDIEREMEEGRGEEGTPEQQQRSQHVQASAVIRNPTNTWPNAIVPYVLSSGLRKYRSLVLATQVLL